MNNSSERQILTTEMDGYRIHGYEGDYIFSGIQNNNHYYEIGTLEKWTPLLGSPATILDIGANLGNHTLYWAKYLKPKKIVSFEPFPMNYEVLQQNIADNNLELVVKAEMIAVGDSDGYVQTASVDASNLGATTFEQVSATSADADHEGISMTSVDGYAEKHALKVDFIKIDTEGFELAVLKGAQKTIVRDHPAIWVEVSETSHAEVRSFLQNYGYCQIDIAGFNVLYLHREKTDGRSLYDEEKILDMMYQYQGKTNTYYGHYIKTKDQLTAMKERAQKAEENYETTKQWYAAEKERAQKAEENYETTKQWYAAEKERAQKAEENYETIKQWYAAEKERAQKVEENYQTAKQWYEAEKERARKAEENYEAAKSWLSAERENRASTEMRLLQLQYLLEQREVESFDLQKSLTQRIVKAENELKAQTRQVDKLTAEQKKLKDLQKKLSQQTKQLEKKEKELKEQKAKVKKLTADLKKKTLPPIWYVMAGSRVGRFLCKLFSRYHNSKRYFH